MTEKANAVRQYHDGKGGKLNTNYPIYWNYILGHILYPIYLKHIDHIKKVFHIEMIMEITSDFNLYFLKIN
jgi:hypothetical protein